ncbi:hypothetical protein [Streptomyces hoynatensis]|uniref:Uncharacterized protein n=1 Tax=Streptomyces hoynatensis TaxID=1141874 RepID=A0A3A9YGL5_9ACTN|nr:hypothetical protein [Streptomyces hoynatensis]RKN35963.1 hypothetical protein D7294_30500 [Streptomyces hoynatensis]
MSDNSDPSWTAEPVDSSDLEWTRKRLLEAQEEATGEATRADRAEAEVRRLTGLLGEYADRGIANGRRADKAEAAIEEVRQWIADTADDPGNNDTGDLASILEHYGYPAKEEK